MSHEALLRELRFANQAAVEAGIAELALLLKRAHDAITSEDKAWQPVLDKIKETRTTVEALTEITQQQNRTIAFMRQMLETKTPALRSECTWKSVETIAPNMEYHTACGAVLVVSDLLHKSQAAKFCMFCGYKTREESNT